MKLKVSGTLGYNKSGGRHLFFKQRQAEGGKGKVEMPNNGHFITAQNEQTSFCCDSAPTVEIRMECRTGSQCSLLREGKRGAKVPSDREERERERERDALQKALKHRRTVVFAHGRNGSLDCRSMLLLHKNTWAHATPLLPLVYSSPLHAKRGGGQSRPGGNK